MVSSKGKSNVNQSRVAEDRRALKNVGIRDFKIYSDMEKTNVRGRESIGADGIQVKIATKPQMPTRKSSLVTKGANQTNLSDLKGCVKNQEKGKSKHDSSVKIKVGRKALADVSNVGSYSLRNRATDGSKLVKDKSERSSLLRGKIHNANNLNGPRVSVGRSTMGVSASSRVSVGRSTMGVSASSSKPVVGTMRTNQSRGAQDPHTLQNVCISDFKVYSNNQKSKVQGQISFGTDGRMIARKPLIPMRNSLTVTKRVNQTDSSDLKGIVGSSDRGTGNSVKIKLGRKAVYDVSNARSYLWRNRASDGLMSVKGKTEKSNFLQRMYVSGVPLDKSTVDASALSRKPLRPIGRTTVTVSRSRLTSKSKCTSGLKKSISAAATSLKRTDELSTKSVPKNIALDVSHESSLEKLPSDGNSCPSRNTTDVISRNKCSRRRSFTSSLMARSEVIGECVEVIKQDELPNIDDNANHLEVAEYVDDIYQYYWVMEAQNPSLANYMVVQADITPKMRGILVNWLIEVHLKFELMQETLFLMVELFDRFLSIITIKRNEMQLVGLTSLLLASKYEDFWHPKVKDLICILEDSCTRDQMLAMEKLILKKLLFRLNAPTPYVFMLRFLKAAQSDSKLEHLAFYLIELCLVEYEALKFKPSLLCASAIYVARCTLQMTPAWSALLCKHTHYEESELRVCANLILRFQKAAGKGHLKVTYEKFMRPDRSCVAAIKAMNRLPR